MFFAFALVGVALFVGAMVALYVWSRRVEREDLPRLPDQLSDEERRALQLGIGLTAGGNAGGAPH